jgi:hypothetical protein
MTLIPLDRLCAKDLRSLGVNVTSAIAEERRGRGAVRHRFNAGEPRPEAIPMARIVPLSQSRSRPRFQTAF